jgi:hypothetical protein
MIESYHTHFNTLQLFVDFDKKNIEFMSHK